MDENDSLAFKDRTLDEIIEHLASDIQGDNQFNHMRFPPSSTPPASLINQDFPSENPQNFAPQRNLFFQENYQSHQRGSLPFIFNTREDVRPAMVDVGGGNYVVYETVNAQKNQNVPNVHFIKKTNGTLSGFNDYGVEYTGMDYNLFQGMSPQRHAVPQYHQATENNMKAQLIENLVGNWAPDQTGTYSPFGPSLGGVRSADVVDNVGIGRGSRKTRIVAEVRPMRPSYSDVLSKSITNNQKPNNKTSQEVKQKTNETKAKTLKSSIGRTLSGNGNMLNRQNSSVIDDSNLMGLNTPLKGNSFKKSDCENENDSLSKKWLSLDDLNDASRQDDYINISDVKSKKNSPKNTNNKGNKKDKWETTQLNNSKNANSKPSVQKKQEKVNVKLQNNMTKEKENIPGQKSEPVKVKPSSGEERRGTPSSSSKSDQQKSARRSNRPSQPEKHRKTVKGKRKDQDSGLSAMIKNRIDRYGGVLLFALRWLLHLVLDVLGLSIHLALHMCAAVWASTMLNTAQFYNKLSHSIRNIEFFQRILNSRFNPFKKTESKKNQSSDSDDESDDSGEAKVKRKIPRGLKHNISLPVTGEEAMKRLLACKGKDPYSILGVTQDCTDDDIKKYYKRQAFLVHPDKNNQPGAEEAFKILVHAFDIIGEPEHRKSYDRTVEKTQVEQAAWSELSDLLSQLHKKMEYVANTIRCTNCNKRHKRTTVDRPIYAARMCGQCKIHHSVREGDIWAETSLFGFLWHYYACMDGAVYDITEWAGCQGSNLRNLKANTHNVQYRIVLGKQPGQKQRYQHPTPTSEPDFEDFLNNLYTKSESGSQGQDADVSSSSANRKRKTKKKK